MESVEGGEDVLPVLMEVVLAVSDVVTALAGVESGLASEELASGIGALGVAERTESRIWRMRRANPSSFVC